MRLPFPIRFDDGDDSVDPLEAMQRHQRALSREAQGDIERALDDLDAAVASDPENAAILRDRGRLLVTLASGGVTSIIGPNGAGKSTFLSLISRLLGMDAGSVTVDGLDVSRTPSDLLAQRLSILRQDNHLSARLTVNDLVAFGRYPYSKGRLTIEDKGHIERALDYLNLGDLRDRFLDELSSGQRQRAFVAMVLCQDTEYVLLDEPLNNLDMKHASIMMKLLKRASCELGKTVVLVLHDINFASWYSDHIVAMRDGRIERQGRPDEVMTRDDLRAIYDMDIDVREIEGRRISLFYG